MEYFDYSDWLADGRRAARAKGKPDLDTERLELQLDQNEFLVVYCVDLQTTDFRTVVKEYNTKQFSTRFFSMLAVEEAV